RRSARRRPSDFPRPRERRGRRPPSRRPAAYLRLMPRQRGPADSAEHPTLIDVGDAQSGLPRAVVPMRPRLARRAFNSPDYLFELKWDGIRALLARDRSGLRLVDRSGGDLVAAIPELRDVSIPDGTLLDGE